MCKFGGMKRQVMPTLRLLGSVGVLTCFPAVCIAYCHAHTPSISESGQLYFPDVGFQRKHEPKKAGVSSRLAATYFKKV